MRLLTILLILMAFILCVPSGEMRAQSPNNLATRISFADVDNNNTLDLVLSNNRLLNVYLNSGTVPGSEIPPEFTLYYAMPVDPSSYMVCGAFADIDLDGDMDLFF